MNTEQEIVELEKKYWQALKERDGRNAVTSLYLLDPTRVRPLVSPKGEVYYQLSQDYLSGLDESSVVVPAREIIHDTMFALFHPLCGLSPIFACGIAALQGMTIVNNATRLFKRGSNIGGVVVAPTAISAETALRLEPSSGRVFSRILRLAQARSRPPEEIVEHCRASLARFKVPKRVVFGELPKTSTGKIQKFLLREQAKAPR